VEYRNSLNQEIIEQCVAFKRNSVKGKKKRNFEVLSNKDSWCLQSLLEVIYSATVCGFLHKQVYVVGV